MTQKWLPEVRDVSSGRKDMTIQKIVTNEEGVYILTLIIQIEVYRIYKW